MLLELQLIKQPAGTLPIQRSCQFVEQGGTIGRAEHCEFVLPDETKSISKAHALVHYRDGAYFLTDVSSNGVFVNNDPIPIGKGNTKQIFSGDQFRMGDYLLQANVGASAKAVELRKAEQDEIEKLLSNKDDLSELLMEEVARPTEHSSTHKLHASEQSIDAILNTFSPPGSMLDFNAIPTQLPNDDNDLLAELIGGTPRSTHFNSVELPSHTRSEQLAEQIFTEILNYVSPEKFAGMFANADTQSVYTEENFRAFCEMLHENKELIVAAVIDKLNKK